MCMVFHLKMKKTSGLQTSPWIILGSTAILLTVVLVLAIANTNRERRYMAQVLKTKGAALIQAVEAGARTGMAAMMWRNKKVGRARPCAPRRGAGSLPCGVPARAAVCLLLPLWCASLPGMAPSPHHPWALAAPSIATRNLQSPGRCQT